MRRVLLLLPLFVLAGCKEEVPQGAVKVTVTYSGFLPECVLVKARDTDSGKELSTEVAGKGTRASGGSLVIAVIPPKDWGDSVKTVEVEAQAFEKSCAGKAVVSRSMSVTLTPGEAVTAPLQLVAEDKDQDGYVDVLSGGTDCRDGQAAIYPGAQELCNDVDDNCDGRPDTVELQLGENCTEGASCTGTRGCGVNGTVVCNVPNATLAYPDVDRDNRGDRNATATSFCAGVPAGFVTGSNDDCDDTRANVFPGAMERCDGLDNNCSGGPDENFPGLGTACTDPTTQCGGQTQCNEAGDNVRCLVTQSASTWYLDEDGDGFGRDAGAQTSCVRPAGAYVNQGGDCDDGNRFTAPGATELCDALDNNCDGQPEAAASCPGGTRTWFERTEGTGIQTWHSVSTWTPGGVWAVGNNNRRAVLTPGTTNFVVTQSAANNCGDTSTTAWYGVWADPMDGRAYFTSASGRLAHQTTGATTCTQVTATELATYGIVGLRNNQNLSLYGVSDSSDNNEGAAFIWDGVSTTVTFNAANNDLPLVFDIHGQSADTLFVVGNNATGTRTARISRFNPSNSQWIDENVQATASGTDPLKGIWVVNEKLAFAVGDNGSVVRWNGTTWSNVIFPNNHDLTSVVAFGASSAYATCASGHIYRYNGQNWQNIHSASGTRLNDIAGTSPEDIWVVGNSGKILHWPR
ncbi:MopE-related protein [Pyxidicoccus sp. 3LG]